jgi:hypothetical protein
MYPSSLESRYLRQHQQGKPGVRATLKTLMSSAARCDAQIRLIELITFARSGYRRVCTHQNRIHFFRVAVALVGPLTASEV